MSSSCFENCIIFGGAGFIGNHLMQFLLNNGLVGRIVVADIKKPDLSYWGVNPLIEFIHIDVRLPFSLFEIGKNTDLIINLAAIHREPGHKDYEYFETNLLGAVNVCNFAEAVGCHHIIFTSSISPYGVSEAIKNESTLPIPVTPYGSSKLVAEKIYLTWQAKNSGIRRLLIARPGVVFGPGEGGNVSRLIKAVVHRYFFYMGNSNTRKAGIYVKELCNAMWWVFNNQEKNGENVALVNMTMNPGPSIKEYAIAACTVAGIKRYISNVPYKFLLAASYLINFFARPFGVKHPFSPVRIRKLIRSNNIIPQYLVDHGYRYQYTLESAFDDWKKSSPEEWR